MKKHVKAPKTFVYNWWTNLEEDDAQIVVPLISRKIVDRSEDCVLMQDVVKVLGQTMSYSCRVEFFPPNAWIAYYDGKVAEAKSSYRLYDEGGETGLDYNSEIIAKGFFTKLALPILKSLIRHVFSNEANVYISKLESDWKNNIR